MNIKAILINEPGSFRQFNGMTFDVDTRFMSVTNIPLFLPSLDHPGEFISTIVPVSNVLFVDAAKVGQYLYDNSNWGCIGAIQRWNSFQSWAKVHGFGPNAIAYFNIQYYCPA